MNTENAATKQLTAAAVAQALRRAGIAKYAPRNGGEYVTGAPRVIGSLSGYAVRQDDWEGRHVSVWAHGSRSCGHTLENYQRILTEAGFNASRRNDWQGRPMAYLTVVP